MLETLFKFGQVAAIFIIVISALVLALELSGRSIYLTRPFLRKTNFHWSAMAVATTGIAAAVLTVSLSIGATFVLVPGFVTLNGGRGLEPVVGLLFGMPGVVAGLIANPITDILTGKFSLGTIAGTVTTSLASYLYWRAFRDNPGLSNFASPKVWLKYVGVAAFVALVVKATGIAGWLAALNLMPQSVAWYVAFPATLFGQFVSHVVIGPILTKILYPFVDRIGLAYEPESDVVTTPITAFDPVK